MKKLNNIVVLDQKALMAIANGDKMIDNRVNNTGRPVNKKSTRQIRLAKQAMYNRMNTNFINGKKFTINNKHNVYQYCVGDNGNVGCIANEVGMHVCNVQYVGRTKVEGFTYVLDKYVSVKINLKEVTFIK